MAVWSEVKTGRLSSGLRLDAEHYQPLYLSYEKAVASGDLLGDLVVDIIHPVELTRVYEETGVPVLLAQNIRPNRIKFSPSVFMPESVRNLLARSRLHAGDVVMTRSGANFGDSASYFGSPPGASEYYACADCLIIRSNHTSSGYLASYFSSKVGRALLTRGSYGAGQPHISPTYLRTLRIPRFGQAEQRIHSMVEEARSFELFATSEYSRAQKLLLASLGLEDLDRGPRLFFQRTYSEIRDAGRFDADYFSPYYQFVLERLSENGKTIGDVASLARRKFTPTMGTKFQYIEISDLTGEAEALSQTIEAEEAPSRAQWIVQPGDVITSTVRPIRRLSALIGGEQGGFVCSSGFAVLSPTEVEPEVLLTYLRTPIISEILDLNTTASMYPAISEERLLRVPISLPSKSTRLKIVERIRASLSARRKATRLLADATIAVDRLIFKDLSS